MQHLSVLTNSANINQQAADAANDVQNNNNNNNEEERRGSFGLRRTLSGRRRLKARSIAADAQGIFARLILKTVIHDQEKDDEDSFYFILKKALEQEALLARHDGEVEDDRQLSREELLDKIRKKKAIIERLRCQPWSMLRKRRTLTLAQKYLQRHEAKVSKWHLLREEIKRKWKKAERWLVNISIYLIPWEAKIKTIESRFGSVVSSYFTFLRWIFWVNMIMTLFMVSFIVIPECLADAFADEDRRNHSDTIKRKTIDDEETESASYLQTVWDYKGYISVSPLFYGYYSSKEYILTNFKYQLPLAYFLVNIFTLGYSFFAILRKMASNTRLSKLTGGKTEQYPFAWKIFTGWDYSIGNAETAANTVMANANKLREAIMEYKTKQKQKFAWIRVLMRVLANVVILCMIAGSAYAIYAVVERSKLNLNPTAFEQNQVAIVVSFITLIFPNFFELISKALEGFHPRTALRVHLGRILALYLLNFYTLIIALLTKINSLRAEQEALFNVTASSAAAAVSAATTETVTSTRMTNMYEYVIDEPARVVRHLVQDNDNSDLKHLKSILTGAMAPVTVASINFTFLTSSLAISLLSKAARPEFFPSTTSSLRALHQTAPTRSSVLPRVFQGSRFKHQVEGTQTAPLILSTPHSSTPDPVSTTSEFYGPLLWAIVHPDIGTVGVNKVTAYIDGSTPAPTPNRPSERIMAAITQRERHLQRLCWETWVGQEIAKLITMDLVMTIASVLLVDFIRGLWVRYCHRWWCWSLETTFPEYGEFKVAENVLHIINNQGMIWLGLFFCPLLPAMNNLKLVILMYVRGWAVMACNVPATQVFRASRSSNFYLLLLLLMLFLCTLPVGFLIASYRPSTTCGPFSSIDRFYHIITNRLESQVPAEVYKHIDMIASPGIIIPVLLMLGLIIYFLISLVRGLREANQDLQRQLIHERTEEKRKIYRLAGGGKHSDHGHTKRTSMSLPDTRKVDISHLPVIEQKRRDAWRTRLALDDDTHSENENGNEGALTPLSEDSSPKLKQKRSLRSLLTPVLGERDITTAFASEVGKRDKKEQRAFEIYNEEDDRKNLMERWKGPRLKSKIPPIATLDDDDTLLKTSLDSPTLDGAPSLECDPQSIAATNRQFQPPAYKLLASSSKPVVPLIVKESPPTPPGIYQVASAKTLLAPCPPGIYPGPSKRLTRSSRSSPSIKSSDSARSSFFSDSPSVVLATSGDKEHNRRRIENLGSTPAKQERRISRTRLSIADARSPSPKARAAATSGHFRWNIEDEDGDSEGSDRLLTLPEMLQKPAPPQRKFRKSASSAFLQWSSPGPIRQKQQLVAVRKTSLTITPAPTPPMPPPRAKFTISVTSPGDKKIEGASSDASGVIEAPRVDPVSAKRYVIRQSPTFSRPEPPRKKSRGSVLSTATPARLTVVSEVTSPGHSPSGDIVGVRSDKTRSSEHPVVTQATVSVPTHAQQVAQSEKRQISILEQAIENLAQAGSTGGYYGLHDSERRPSTDTGRLAPPPVISERRPSAERNQSKSIGHGSERRPSTDCGAKPNAPRCHGRSERRQSTDRSGQRKSVQPPHNVSMLGPDVSSGPSQFSAIRPPPPVRPASMVQPFMGSQGSLSKTHSSRKDSLSQQNS